MTHRNTLGFATRCVHAGQENDPTTGAVMTPIYATSTFAQSSPGVHKGFEYARSQNPTRMVFERCIADLEGGSAGFAFASGMAATATVLDCLEKILTWWSAMTFMAARDDFSIWCASNQPGSRRPTPIFPIPKRSMARYVLTRTWYGDAD